MWFPIFILFTIVIDSIMRDSSFLGRTPGGRMSRGRSKRVLRRKSKKRSKRRFYKPGITRTIYYRGVQYMTGDGNCLFRSLVYPSDDHSKMRKTIAHHIRHNWERFREFVDVDERNTYLHRITHNGVWGDELVISAFNEIFDIPVTVYNNANEIIQKYPGSSYPEKKLLFSGSHYDVIE